MLRGRDAGLANYSRESRERPDVAGCSPLWLGLGPKMKVEVVRTRAGARASASRTSNWTPVRSRRQAEPAEAQPARRERAGRERETERRRWNYRLSRELLLCASNEVYYCYEAGIFNGSPGSRARSLPRHRSRLRARSYTAAWVRGRAYI